MEHDFLLPPFPQKPRMCYEILLEAHLPLEQAFGGTFWAALAAEKVSFYGQKSLYPWKLDPTLNLVIMSVCLPPPPFCSQPPIYPMMAFAWG